MSKDRTAILKQRLDLSRTGLEIGPLHNPCIPKRGTHVLYVDHLATEPLREKYRADGFQFCDDIEDVDIVVGDGKLANAVGERKFAYVVASHVIEHIPNPIQWFEDLHALLEPGGIVALAIPDKRFCFDRLRNTTTTSQWIEAYLDQRQRPSAGSIFDALHNEVVLDGNITWARPDVGAGSLRHLTSPREALAVARRAHATSLYRDVHCSVFTPTSFFTIIRQLCVLDLFSFAVDGFVDSIGHEFFVSLKKQANPDWIDVISSIPIFRERRFASIPANFDPQYYLRVHADVAAQKVDPLEHFLNYGRREGREYCAK